MKVPYNTHAKNISGIPKDARTLQEKIQHAIESQLTVSLKFCRVKESYENGQPEGYCSLSLWLASMNELQLEVREHHGKSYSRQKKAEMLRVLAQVKGAIEETLAPIEKALTELPSEPDEEEGK